MVARDVFPRFRIAASKHVDVDAHARRPSMKGLKVLDTTLDEVRNEKAHKLRGDAPSCGGVTGGAPASRMGRRPSLEKLGASGARLAASAASKAAAATNSAKAAAASKAAAAKGSAATGFARMRRRSSGSSGLSSGDETPLV